jgi:hypothetical protein
MSFDRQIAVELKQGDTGIGSQVSANALAKATEVRKAIYVGNEGFAFASVRYSDGSVQPLMASMIRVAGELWFVTSVKPVFSPVRSGDLPARGSSVCSRAFMRGLAGGIAIGLVCDPTLTRLEVRLANGKVIDEDLPANGTALLATDEGTGAILGYRGEAFVFGRTLVGRGGVGVAREADRIPDAEMISEVRAFASSFLAGEPFRNQGLPVDLSFEETLIPIQPAVVADHWGLGMRDWPAEGAVSFVIHNSEGGHGHLHVDLGLSDGDWVFSGLMFHSTVLPLGTEEVIAA